MALHKEEASLRKSDHLQRTTSEGHGFETQCQKAPLKSTLPLVTRIHNINLGVKFIG